MKNHRNTPVDDETVDELRKKNPTEDLSLLLKKRDIDWINKSKGLLQGNLRRFSEKLVNKRDSNKPAELLKRALDALQMVDSTQDSFYQDPYVEEMVREINKITWELKKQLEKK